MVVFGWLMLYRVTMKSIAYFENEADWEKWVVSFHVALVERPATPSNIQFILQNKRTTILKTIYFLHTQNEFSAHYKPIIWMANEFSYGVFCVCVMCIIITIIFTPISISLCAQVCILYLFMCLHACVRVCVYLCSFHFRPVFQQFTCMHVFIWIKWRQINCINEPVITNSDVSHVFYYFPFCMCWEQNVEHCWKFSARYI